MVNHHFLNLKLASIISQLLLFLLCHHCPDALYVSFLI